VTQLANPNLVRPELPPMPDFLSPMSEPPIDAEFRRLSPVGESPTNPAWVSNALQLDRFNLDRIMARIKTSHPQAMAAKGKINREALRDRQAYMMEDKKQRYPGQPNGTLPLTRNKLDGIMAQLHSTLYGSGDGIFSAEPETDSAADAGRVWDAAMRRELRLDNAEFAIKMAMREAAIVGTSFLGMGLTMLPNGEIALQANVTKLENFDLYPVEVDDIAVCTTFRRYAEPYYVLKRMASQGILDRQAVWELGRRYGGMSAPLTKNAKDNWNQVSFFDDENSTKELLEVYIRYEEADPSDVYATGFSFSSQEQRLGEPQLYQVICTRDSYKPLSVKLNPFREAFDSPPYEPQRISITPGYIFGNSMAKVLRALQRLADNAMNDRQAYNKFAITPILQGDSSNPIFQRLSNGGRIPPGFLIPTNGRPDVAGIQALQLPQPLITLEDMQLASQWGDLATFSDQQLSGTMPTKRMTLGEVQASRGAGELKLRLNTEDIGMDQARAATKLWALYDAYKVARNGVEMINVDDGQLVLSSDEIDEGMIADILDEIGQEAMQNQDQATLEQMASGIVADPAKGQVSRLGKMQLVNGGIASTRRGDLTWRLSNLSTVADKRSQAQALMQFAPYMQWVPQADQDSRVWWYLKMIAEALEITSYKKLIGADPRAMQDPQAYATMQTVPQENMAKRSVM
jgi:hypothetical protein